MATIVAYSRDQRLDPIAQQTQRAPQVGFGQEVGAGLQSVARGVDQYAAGREIADQKQDEAIVGELDTFLADKARQVQSSYLATNGRAALDNYDTALKDWDQAARDVAGSAVGPRQQGMLNALIQRRSGMARDAMERHRAQQGDVYYDQVETGRIASLGVDYTTAVLEGRQEDANSFDSALRESINGRVNRKGEPPETARLMLLEVMTENHKNVIGGLIERDDPHSARDYLTRNAEQIDPKVLTTLREEVRERVYEYDADNEVRNDPPDREPGVQTVKVEGTTQRIAMSSPVSAGVGSRFGPRRSPGGVGSTNHRGVDYPVPVGTPVTATLPGVVRWKDDPDGYGRYAVVDHGDGLETRYAHLSATQAREGQVVQQGDVIGLSGGARGAAGSGNSQGAHVHYEVRRGGVAVNPETAVGRVQTATVGDAEVDAGAMPTTLDDVLEWADAKSGGDRRYRQVLERAATSRLSQNNAIKAEAEREAWDAVQAYLPDGSSPVTDISAIPRDAWNRLSPQAQNSVRGQIRAVNEREAQADTAVQDQTFNSLMDIAASATTESQFTSLNLDEYASVVSRGQLNSLKATQRSMRNESTPSNQTLQGRTAQALQGFTPARNAYLATMGVEANSKDPDDQRTIAQFNDAITRAVGTFIAQAGRAPTDQERNGMMATLSREVVIRPNSGFMGLGGPETRRAFQGGLAPTFVPNGDARTIRGEFRRRGVENPSEAQIRAAYEVGLRNGTYQPPED